MNLKRLLEIWREDRKLYDYLRSNNTDLLYDDLRSFYSRLCESRYGLWNLEHGYKYNIQKLIDLNEQDYRFFDYLWNQYLDLDIDKKRLEDWEGRLLEAGEILDSELAKCNLQTVNQ